MEETNTAQSKSSGEANLLNQLNKFEFNSPLKIDVIFEDSDDEQETKIKIEKYLSPKYENHPDTNEIVQPSTVNNTTSSGVINAIKEEDNRKRKLEDEYSIISKMSKTDKCDKVHEVMKEVNPQSEKQNLTLNCLINAPFSNNNEDMNNSTNTHIAAYVCNLLKAVSRHLILIFDSYYRYRQTKSLNNQGLTYNAYQNFLRAKCHFFNLSFCTVANVILPEIQNRSFIVRFLTDTLSLAKERNINLNLDSELGPLFAELVNWTKKKKIATDSAEAVPPKPSEVDHSPTQVGSPLLMQQLRQPPLEIVTKKIGDNQQNRNIDAGITIQRQNCLPNASSFEQTQPSLDQNLESYDNINKNVNPFTSYCDKMFRVARRDHPQFVIPTNNQITVNHNVTSHTKSTISQSNKSMDTNASKSILLASGPLERRLSISVAPSLVQTCTLEESSKNTSNVLINQKQVQYQRQNLQQPAQFHKLQMLQQHSVSNVVSTPNAFYLSSYPGTKINNELVDQRTPKISLHQQIPNCHQQLQKNVQQHQNYRLQMSQQMMLSNVQKSCHVPTFQANYGHNIVDQRQFQIPLHNQQNCQQQQHYQNQMSQQIIKANVDKLDRFIAHSTNNLPSTNTLQMHPPASTTWESSKPTLLTPEIEKLPPPYPIKTFSFETEYHSLLETNEIQKQTKGKEEIVVQSSPSIQYDSSNAEITRSVSTDSGFMSPLNFETNKERPADDDSSTPVITHITSLNPGASYIAESNCCVCGKATRKMCIGCYKKYYCSVHCQRTDWNSHMPTCKQSKSVNSIHHSSIS